MTSRSITRMFEVPTWLALATSVLCSLVVWALSFRRHNVGYADRTWPVLIGVAALVFVLGAALWGDRLVVMLAVGLAWALRLCTFITWRSWAQPEGGRYAEMRRRNQPNFDWKSLCLVFVLQAVLAKQRSQRCQTYGERAMSERPAPHTDYTKLAAWQPCDLPPKPHRCAPN
jgi:steroid 5-alpha reductase family enzyme